MWPWLVQLAKEGGVDVIETYVFWNGHALSPNIVSYFPARLRLLDRNGVILSGVYLYCSLSLFGGFGISAITLVFYPVTLVVVIVLLRRSIVGFERATSPFIT